MTMTVKKKPGRKSNAERAALAAARERLLDADGVTVAEALGAASAAPFDTLGEDATAAALDATDINPMSWAEIGPIADPTPPVKPTLPSNPLGVLETQVLIDEAFEVFDTQEEQTRFDTLNRYWVFRPDMTQPDNQACMLIRCERGPDVREQRISNAYMTVDMGRKLVRDAVLALSEERA